MQLESVVENHLGALTCGLRGLDVTLQSKGLLVRFPVRACAWVSGSVLRRGTYEREPIHSSSPSLSLSPPHSLNIDK